MIEIIGRYNTALCYTDRIDDIAREQLTAICDQEAFASSKIRIMPDVHAGKGATIGTTLTLTDKVVPSMVGVDIGCGMHTVYLGQVDIDLALLDEAAHYIPSGKRVWEEAQEDFDLSALICYDALRDMGRLHRSLGTLGGGNHFIEVDEDDEGGRYLVVHSGSRNLGVQVAEFYQAAAVDLNLGKDAYFAERERIIAEYKEQGRQGEIQDALKALEQEFEAKEPSMPRSLCYLEGKLMEDYLHDVDICQRFAKRSRELMAEILMERAGLTAEDSFLTIHNYVDIESMILRKGSVSAKAGEKLLIPINMRDGALICIGRGNEDWNCSAPHGAGRLMSRAAAMERLSMEEYQAQMAGIYTTCVNPYTLDESPMAYKSLDEIVGAIGPTAEIVKRIRPIYNFKAN